LFFLVPQLIATVYLTTLLYISKCEFISNNCDCFS